MTSIPRWYAGDDPINATDPSGSISVEQTGELRGKGSINPTARAANKLGGKYKFYDWFVSDLGHMVQRVRDTGKFEFSSTCGSATVHWEESYDEGWVRGIYNYNYSFPDHHIASPHGPALAVEEAMDGEFTDTKGTLLFKGSPVSSWSFTMTATFEMRNVWRDDWVPLRRALTATAEFAGAGNQTWFSVVAFSWAGYWPGVVFGTPGFERMLYPNRGKAPPVGPWHLGKYHGISEDSWSITWNAGQGSPSMSYTGGYH